MSRRAAVWARYRDNTARHFIGIGRDLQHRTLHHLTTVLGYSGLRPSLAPLLSLVALETRPLGMLAAQLGISPQACSQLVNVGERSGYLERQADASDRRTRRVGLTERGRSLVDDAAGILHEVETDYRQRIGTEAYDDLTRLLDELFRGLGIPAPADSALSKTSTPSTSKTSPTPSTPSTRSLGVLPMISVRIQKDLMEATSARGHVGLKMSHAQVLPMIGSDGARIHQLARIQRTSRQAISATARDLESLGVLDREPDPLDRRGVVYRLTDLGTRLIEDSVASLDQLDESFEAVLGARDLGRLQSVARSLYQALHLEEEIFEARSEALEQVGPPAEVHTPQGDPSLIDLSRLAATLEGRLGPTGAKRLADLLEARNQASDSRSTERVAALPPR